MRLNVEIADKIEVRYEDAVFYVRPITVDKYLLIKEVFLEKVLRGTVKKKKKTKDMDIDMLPEGIRLAFGYEILSYSIVGWENIQNEKGQDIPCNEENIRRVLTRLASKEDLVSRLVDAAMSLINTLEEEGKKID